MSQICPDVALARSQVVWAVFEDVPGVLQFPTANDTIRVTQDVSLNQNNPTTDSREKAESLDTMNVFQGIAEPATADIGMYIRTTGIDTAPQGDTIMRAIQGRLAVSLDAELADDITVSSGTIKVSAGYTGEILARGVLEIENALADKELVHYRTVVTETDGSLTFSDLIRGYNSTTPIAATAGDMVKCKSRAYVQDVCRQEFSLWVKIDKTLQACQGCRVTTSGVSIAVGDAVEITSTVNGRRVFNAGQSDLASSASIGATTITVEDSRAFFVGQRIQNATKKDDNAKNGYLVTDINQDTNEITIFSGLGQSWAIDDVITWWMPSGSPVGKEVENRDTTLRIDGQLAKLRPGTLTINTPVTFTEEVGDRYPGQGIDDMRNITIDYNVLMRKDAAIRLREGLEGKEVRVDAEFGKTPGKNMSIVMPRVKLTMPSINFSAPTVELATSGRALGTRGEDSLQIIFE